MHLDMHGQDDLLKYNLSIRMGKEDVLSDFEHGVVLDARRAGLSISETADLLGFSHRNISRVYREWFNKYKISKWQKCLVDARGEWPDWFELIERQDGRVRIWCEQYESMDPWLRLLLVV